MTGLQLDYIHSTRRSPILTISHIKMERRGSKMNLPSFRLLPKKKWRQTACHNVPKYNFYFRIPPFFLMFYWRS